MAFSVSDVASLRAFPRSSAASCLPSFLSDFFRTANEQCSLRFAPDRRAFLTISEG